MNRLRKVLLACLLPLGLLAAGAGAARAAPDSGQDIVVQLDRKQIQAGPGDRLTLKSTIRNDTARPLTGFVAHLNILTTDSGVYVDPEDWSPRRTQYLDTLPPGGSTRLTWDVRAVTSGPLILYVSVTSPEADNVTSSGPLNLTVSGQRVVNSAGVVPLVAWVPTGVLALFAATLLRRRRHR